MAKARRGRRRPRAGSAGLPGAARQHWRADGQPKTRFPSRDQANRSALLLRLEVAADLEPYGCELCGGWHLGNRREGG
ncbi:MAG TPA: hypothetical protein VMV06_05695 [Acidimicrobiales bacterium]|nr:hypothetical protein [Acidimicrobiales bacterium]